MVGAVASSQVPTKIKKGVKPGITAREHTKRSRLPSFKMVPAKEETSEGRIKRPTRSREAANNRFVPAEVVNSQKEKRARTGRKIAISIGQEA